MNKSFKMIKSKRRNQCKDPFQKTYKKYFTSLPLLKYNFNLMFFVFSLTCTSSEISFGTKVKFSVPTGVVLESVTDLSITCGGVSVSII